ncbi:hypothetical protein HX870_19625 [Pseudomonas gingeri]|uniref:Uncharacterized protein n=2 Tax=Pseudomonas gingeri TaxID=117681 RepID=A0A7Y7XIE7_9PSED|nr:hypothetical protein [Pseudomonas gingeri]NWC00256.1 hypothetical protein [Pseudomonas gingeri]NWD69811.1 hypothetical protein [Pseudomonas gingeri]NWD78113.1 hypothetical protein [Pseudomonas gingeri]
MGFIEEAPMSKWAVTFVDDHGVRDTEHFECASQPDLEQAARLIRAKLLPVPAALDLNDLDGRTPEPTVKSLKDQNSIQILSITPSP